MRHSFYCRIPWLLLCVFLTEICGCTSLMDVVPPPPGFLSKIDLSGPFDPYIPADKANQIKSTSLMLNEAVPYIFISVAAGFESVGDQEKSIHFFNRAIVEFRKRSNTHGEATAWTRKITAFQRYGKDAEALNGIREMEKKWSGTQLQAFVFFNHGHYYAISGNLSKALEYFARALQSNEDYAGNPDLTMLRRDTELEYGMALILGDYFPVVSGRLFAAPFDESFYQEIRRNVTASLSHLTRAAVLNDGLKITSLIRYFPEMVPSYMDCDLQNYLGLAYGMEGQSARAVSHLKKAGNLARRNSYLLGEADSVFFLNQVYLLDKNTSAGHLAAADLEIVADRHQLPSYTIWAKVFRSHHSREAGDIQGTIDALTDVLQALEQYDSWLASFPGFRGIGSFRRQAILETLFDLQIQQNNYREAFRMAERIKALPLANLCGAEENRTTPAAAEGFQQLHVYRQNMIHSYQRLLSPVNTPSVFTETAHAIRKTQKAFLETRVLLKQKDEALFALICNDPPAAEAMQKLLDQNTTLFSYYCGAQLLYAWVISKKGFYQEIIRLSRVDVERIVQDYHQAARSGDKSRLDVLSEKMYDMLLRPVIPFVNGDRLGIMPHGPLHRLPFASMRYVKSYLVDSFSIYYLPHTGMMTQPLLFAAVDGSKQWLTITDAPTGKTQPVIRQTVRSFLMNASKNDVLKLNGRYDMIDFDLDCYLSDRGPLTSGLFTASLLQDQGYLNVYDLLRLSVKGRMSVVRACRMDERVSMAGVGLAAVSGALITTATPSVLMSLWPVDDRPKSLFMQYLYKNLEKNEDSADALRAAQNEMIHAGASPSDWAGYLLIGRP